MVRRLFALAVVGMLLPAGCAGFLGGLFTATRSEFTPPEPDALEKRLAEEPSEPNGKVDHFAVLIGADTELRHRGNLSLAYQVLLEQGYDRRSVYIFDSEGQTPFAPVTDVTTRAAVYRLFERLALVVEPHDTLLVYVTGHGRRVTADEEQNGNRNTLGVSTLSLNPGEELTQDEFAALLERVRPEVGLAFFDQCYWGQFATPALCNYITITTTEEDETSHGVSFPRAFWQAFRERPHDAGPPTILEAFKYAMVADKATRLGMNRPRISHGCVNPDQILLLGRFKDGPDTQPAAASVVAPQAGDSGTRP